MKAKASQSDAAKAPGALLERAILAHQSGRVAEARSLCERVLKTSPDHHAALYLAGVCHLQQGQPAAAIPFIERTLASRPDFAAAHSNLGAALNALGRHDDAVARYKQALAIRPNFAEAHHNLGNALAALKRVDEAIPHYSTALALRPRYPEAHKNLGDALAAVGRHHDACAHYEAALALQPDHVDALNNLGNSLAALHQPEAAIAQYARALDIAPNFAEAQSNLAVALAALARHDEALSRFGKAIALKCDFAEAHYNTANSLAALGRPHEAIARYQQAVALDANYAAAHYNLGTALAALNRHEESVASFDRALAIDPAYPDAEWNRSLGLLALGRLRDGLPGYESRWARAAALTLPNDHLPVWTGREGVAGRTVLIQHEQGYGDAIQMLRLVADLERAGARCAIQAAPALSALLARSFPNAQVVPLGDCPPDVGLRIPVMSLPLALQLFAESEIPAALPYLVVSQPKAVHWAARLDAGSAPLRTPRVGLVWRGLGTHANDHNRSLALNKLSPLLRRTGIQFVSLQKGLTPFESRYLAGHRNVLVADEALESFDDTAAVMAALDLVISVDSAPAHLAGALGKPTWMLLPFSPDWRWMLARDDTPWYPTMRLFRQQSTGDWSTVVAQVGAALEGWHRAYGGRAPASDVPTAIPD
jgi:tetratricopeptide (TPR) repeat protein